MGTFADNLARLRVAAATGVVPADLVRWVIETISSSAPSAELKEARNIMLREAAARVSGTRWAKARRIEREIREVSQASPLSDHREEDGVREFVAKALELAPPPESFRQLRRVLG